MKPRRGRPRGSEIAEALEAEALRLKQEMDSFERYERERLEVEFTRSMKPVREGFRQAVLEYLHAGGTNAGLGRIIDTSNYYQQEKFRDSIMRPSMGKAEVSAEARIMESVQEISFPRTARPTDPRVTYLDGGDLHEITPVGDEMWLLDGEQVDYAKISPIVSAARSKQLIREQKGEV